MDKTYSLKLEHIEEEKHTEREETHFHLLYLLHLHVCAVEIGSQAWKLKKLSDVES